MTQFNSSNLQKQFNLPSDIADIILTLLIFIIAILGAISITFMEKINRKPYLPTTIYDTCSSTSVCKSPSLGNTIRRTSSYDNIAVHV